MTIHKIINSPVQPSFVNLGVEQEAVNIKTNSQSVSLPSNNILSPQFEMIDGKELMQKLSKAKIALDKVLISLPSSTKNAIHNFLRTMLSLSLTEGLTTVASGPQAAYNRLQQDASLINFFSQFFKENPQVKSEMTGFFKAIATEKMINKNESTEKLVNLLNSRFNEVITEKSVSNISKALLFSLLFEENETKNMLMKDPTQIVSKLNQLLTVFHKTNEFQNFELAKTTKQQDASLITLFSQFFKDNPQTKSEMIEFFKTILKTVEESVSKNQSTGELVNILNGRFKEFTTAKATSDAAKVLLFSLLTEGFETNDEVIDPKQIASKLNRLLTVFRMTHELRNFESGEALKQLANVIQQNSFIQGESQGVSILVPFYTGEGKFYPVHIHVYRERKDGNDLEPKEDIWLRMCLLAQHIGPVEAIFHLFEGKNLSVRMVFENDLAAKEFSRYVPDIQQSFNEMDFSKGGLTIATKSRR